MPRIIHGDIGPYKIQPGYEVTESDDGTFEGSVEYETDSLNSRFLPRLESPHPLFSFCKMYARKFRVMKNGKVGMTGSFFGIDAPQTTPVISTSPGVDRVVIEAHPGFADFAGTEGSELNGAEFDEETGEFIGFFDQDSEFFATRFYLNAKDTVTESFWTRSLPDAIKVMQIVDDVDGYRKPDNVKNLLLVTAPLRQVGSHYQVSKNYLTSGPEGWNAEIYK